MPVDGYDFHQMIKGRSGRRQAVAPWNEIADGIFAASAKRHECPCRRG
jgi:hypothetical protein